MVLDLVAGGADHLVHFVGARQLAVEFCIEKPALFLVKGVATCADRGFLAFLQFVRVLEPAGMAELLGLFTTPIRISNFPIKLASLRGAPCPGAQMNYLVVVETWGPITVSLQVNA